MSNSFERFRRTNQKWAEANKEVNSRFIIKGYPSIEIKGADGIEKQLACVVNQQEKDQAYIYTAIKDKPLSIGSIWEAKGLRWLVAEEIVIIKDVNWRKYKAFLCNTQIDDVWGYFVGPEKSYVNVALKQETVLQSQQKPLLVLAASHQLQINDIVVIKGRPWLIQEKDDISTEGVVYYSLRPTTVDKDIPTTSESYVYRSEEEKPHFEEKDGQDQLITQSTEEGYFWRSSEAIEIIKLSRLSVTFKVPFGLKDATFKVKQNGQIITKQVQ